MKRIILTAICIASSLTAFSQSLNYNDIGVLLSTDNNYGSARYEAMSGAFGALGGDASSNTINPAGGAVANGGTVSVSIGIKSLSSDVNYYGNTISFSDEYFSLPHASGLLSFKIDDENSDWNKFAVTLNYRQKVNFDNYYGGSGNSNYLFYEEHINDSKITTTKFDRSIRQEFSNSSIGQSSAFNIGFSGEYDKRLYVGASLNFHDFNYSNLSKLNEENDDIDGNILNVQNEQSNYIQGDGFSLSIGAIYKVNKNLRLGLAYESPTWYTEIIDEYTEELTMKAISNLGLTNANETPYMDTVYSFRTPSRLTASGAFIFGKQGLISADYSYRDFNNMKYREGDEIFREANLSFNQNYRATHALNLGTEWRFKKLSLRGGYHYEKNPNLLLGNNTNDDNLRGFSLGAGYNFGNTKFDIAYRRDKQTNFYKIYQLNDTNITNNISRITGTLTFDL